MSSPLEPVKRSRYRPEIQGLRAVGALLVASFHLWSDRISGGVDVFFLVSGFLITTSLVGHFDRFGRIKPLAFLGGMARRLMPSMLVVLAASFIGTLVLLPATQWTMNFTQISASALFVENRQLAADSIDYLAKDNADSSVMQFWAVSVQGQFYLVWLILFLVIALLMKAGRSRLGSAVTVLSVVGAVSLVYSMWYTSTNQPAAYFDLWARLWEFALGGLTALLIGRVAVPRWLSFWGGWLGLAAIVACGFVLQVGELFPGYGALWPTLAAVLVLLSGGGSSRWGADKLLGSRPLVWLGGLSFGIYLWHWPIAVFTRYQTGTDTFSVLGGVAIIVSAAVLAWLTKRFVEKPFSRRRFSLVSDPRWPAMAVSLTLVALITACLVGDSTVERRIVSGKENTAQFTASSPDCFGAATMGAGACTDSSLDGELVPDPLVAGADEYPCEVEFRVDEKLFCEFGAPEETATKWVALIGDSLSWHLRPAFDALAKQEGWRVIASHGGGCTPSRVEVDLPEPQRSLCTAWNDAASKVVASDPRIETVFVMNRYQPVIPREGMTEQDTAVQAFVEQWDDLPDTVADIVVIEPTPIHGSEQRVPQCVDSASRGTIRNGTPQCGFERPDTTNHPALVAAANYTGRPVSTISLNEAMCIDATCYGVIGNATVYRDYSHLTATFATTLTPLLRSELVRIGMIDNT